MEVTGMLVVAAGALALALAEHRVARANPGEQVPSIRAAPRTPWSVTALRVLGTGLAVLGAVLATPGQRWPAPVAMVLAWAPTAVVHVAHNRRVRAARAVTASD